MNEKYASFSELAPVSIGLHALGGAAVGGALGAFSGSRAELPKSRDNKRGRERIVHNRAIAGAALGGLALGGLKTGLNVSRLGEIRNIEKNMVGMTYHVDELHTWLGDGNYFKVNHYGQPDVPHNLREIYHSVADHVLNHWEQNSRTINLGRYSFLDDTIDTKVAARRLRRHLSDVKQNRFSAHDKETVEVLHRDMHDFLSNLKEYRDTVKSAAKKVPQAEFDAYIQKHAPGPSFQMHQAVNDMHDLVDKHSRNAVLVTFHPDQIRHSGLSDELQQHIGSVFQKWNGTNGKRMGVPGGSYSGSSSRSSNGGRSYGSNSYSDPFDNFWRQHRQRQDDWDARRQAEEARKAAEHAARQASAKSFYDALHKSAPGFASHLKRDGARSQAEIDYLKRQMAGFF